MPCGPAGAWPLACNLAATKLAAGYKRTRLEYALVRFSRTPYVGPALESLGSLDANFGQKHCNIAGKASG